MINRLKPVETSDDIVTAYDDDGEEYNDPAIEATAKSIQTGPNTSYYIAANINGSLKKPRDGAYTIASMRTSRLSGLKPYKLVKCPKSNFDAYILFLKTNNESHLKLAERILN